MSKNFFVTSWGGVEYPTMVEKLSRKNLFCDFVEQKDDYYIRSLFDKKRDDIDNIFDKFDGSSGLLGHYSLAEVKNQLISRRISGSFKVVNLTRHPILRVDSCYKNFKNLCYNSKKIYSNAIGKITENKLSIDLLNKYQSTHDVDKAALVSFIYVLSSLRNDSEESRIYAQHIDFDAVIENQNYFDSLFEYLKGDSQLIECSCAADIKNKAEEIRSQWQEWQREIFDEYILLESELSRLYSDLGYIVSGVKEQDNSVLISIQLNSNKPALFEQFLNNIEETATNPERIEVLVNIDDDDYVMKEFVEKQISFRKLQLKYIQTHLENGFFDLWKPLNALYKITDPNAYFVSNLFDEVRFKTKGWDKVLEKYVNYYPDNYFRIRLSQFRYRNYIDLWECGFAPDSVAFYTKQWLDVGGDWNPCFGPDSFQQCVAYYLYKSDNFAQGNYYRDIPLGDIEILGEGASHGLEGRDAVDRSRGHLKTWFILFSHKNQLEAKKRALLIKANIENAKNGYTAKVIVNKRKSLILLDQVGYICKKYSYSVSRYQIIKTNFIRKIKYSYYAGGGSQSDASILMHLLKFVYRSLGLSLLRYFVSRILLKIKNLIRRIIIKKIRYDLSRYRNESTYSKKPVYL